LVKMDIELHPMLDLKQNLAIFDASKGKSQAFGYMDLISDFFTANKRFTPEERQKVLATPFVTDKFLKLAAKM